MRLSKIRFSGFKSFVDPTIVSFPSNRVVIVGPNGCGKSNVIDAVKWVLGESSAKNLRGKILEDVIFNGSTTRKPVGQAAVEIVFDNSDQSLSGNWSKYTDIAIRRVVNRDGHSDYYINGHRCRRKDILELFLGTGLGSRSYALIEQGTVSHLVDARPDELRLVLEEASGVSKYKEKRKETSRRLENTNQNLLRIKELLMDSNERLQKLKFQSEQAIEFKALQREEKKLEAYLVYLQLLDLDHKEEQLLSSSMFLKRKCDSIRDEVSNLSQEEEDKQIELERKNKAANTIQEQFYQLEAKLMRLQQDIQHAETKKKNYESNVQNYRLEIEQTTLEIKEDEKSLILLEQEIQDFSKQFEQQLQEEKIILNAQDDLENEENSINQQLLHCQETSHRLHNEKNLTVNRLENLKLREDELLKQQTKLKGEMTLLNPTRLTAQIDHAQKEVDLLIHEIEDDVRSCREYELKIENIEARHNNLNSQLNQLVEKIYSEKAKISTLQELQNQILDDNDHASDNPSEIKKLIDQIQVEKGWEKAVENLLGSFLGAICIEDEREFWGGRHGKANYVLRKISKVQRENTLSSKINSKWSFGLLPKQAILKHTIDEAIKDRQFLGDLEFYVTPEGAQIGKDWIVLDSVNHPFSGFLERKKELVIANQTLHRLEQDAAGLQKKESEIRSILSQSKTNLLETNRVLVQKEKSLAVKRASLTSLGEQREKENYQLEKICEENQLLDKQVQDIRLETSRCDSSLRSLENTLTRAREALESIRAAADAHQKKMKTLRTDLWHIREQKHAIELKLQGKTDHLKNLRGRIENKKNHIQDLNVKKDQADQEIKQTLPNLKNWETESHDLQSKRDQLIGHRNSINAELKEVELGYKNNRILQHQKQEELEEAVIQHQKQELHLQEVKTKKQHLLESYRQFGLSQEEMNFLHPMEKKDCSKKLGDLQRKIQAMGPINMAAIVEYQVESEKAQYLTVQHDDLQEAVDTLKNAIKKIDRASVFQLKTSFNQINEQLNQIFRKLFGGGDCYLNLIGEDWLEAGVEIMAKPPGKKLTGIHLMSGGEKALTAIALIFSIFRLNPAPFCMLDEVDAPLDEANVGRFVNLLKEMANTIQFIMITHNKVSMEFSEHMIGVTMKESGVSRVVSVDIEQALKMVAN